MLSEWCDRMWAQTQELAYLELAQFWRGKGL
jgi:hypothetical protein